MNDEGGADAFLAGYFYGSTVFLDAFFDHVQSKTSAGNATFDGRLSAVKAFKHIGHGLFGDADAFVPDFDPDAAINLFGFDINGAGLGKLNRIFYQILENKVERIFIA